MPIFVDSATILASVSGHPAILQVKTSDDQTFGGPGTSCILTRFAFDGEVAKSIDYALGGTIYLYIYGPQVVTVDISGIAFPEKICSGTTLQPDGFSYLTTFTLTKHAAHPPDFPRVRIDFGGSVFIGHLMKFRIANDDQIASAVDFLFIVNGYMYKN